ncbi:hypothetical protein HanHA300_Chr14g0530591 [Helianthus annuus]|nr:hypothetical protein HanHA300_Chr14g0530591 [Helianthus annuus]KAJ0486328.1 hypothetical protein HanHA89_Chr14g0578471 [Helianthus annuus]KAJ0656880.1 hypothetical protein HanLR1_Chr14g0540891 [Helianthus annuus]KAJ0660480.1 hypothetical protein HanOQP8_Chr14g0538251 [Helianthus annuus]
MRRHEYVSTQVRMQVCLVSICLGKDLTNNVLEIVGNAGMRMTDSRGMEAGLGTRESERIVG